uniref:Uncharacterized protein n=1 Tax=Glossina austeni TaxID=7395 RepID=A0A1A9UL73_GLOAU
MLCSHNGILDPDVPLVLEQLCVWTIYFGADRSLQRERLRNPGERLPIIKNAVRVESNKNPTRLPVFGDCSETDGGVKDETSLMLCFVVLSLRSSTSEERSGSSDDGIPVFGDEVFGWGEGMGILAKLNSLIWGRLSKLSLCDKDCGQCYNHTCPLFESQSRSNRQSDYVPTTLQTLYRIPEQNLLLFATMVQFGCVEEILITRE